jgi:hypothetical protein
MENNTTNKSTIPTKIFIIPYRNRKFLKIHFEKYMEYILEDIPKETYEIYFVHQCDQRPFNRGALKNIGFIAMKDKYPNNYKNITFIFNDIDTMPLEKNYLNYDTKPGIVKHFYGFNFALGGIFSITGTDFEKCGGFPNYWAWGLEDNAIQSRVLSNKLTIDRTQFHNFLDEHILHIPYDFKRILSKQQAWRHKGNKETYTDIKNLKYTIENAFIQVTAFNTEINPANDNYESQILTQKIRPDRNFIPKDSGIKQVQGKWGMGLGTKIGRQSTTPPIRSKASIKSMNFKLN